MLLEIRIPKTKLLNFKKSNVTENVALTIKSCTDFNMSGTLLLFKLKRSFHHCLKSGIICTH